MITYNQFQLRYGQQGSNDVLESIRKKLKLNSYYNSYQSVDKVYNIEVKTDLKYDPSFYKESSYNMNKKQDLIKQKLIQMKQQADEEEYRAKQHMQRSVNLFFHRHRVKKMQEMDKKQFQMQAKRSNQNQIELIIKQNQQEGLQVSGTIVTKLGCKIIYPNLDNIIRATDVPRQGGQIVKFVKPMHPVDLDILKDLRNYVWKVKQFRQFFKFVLKFTQGNLEISEMLVKVVERMRANFYSVMTFYHISNKSWGISQLIKDLNKKGLFQREKQSLYEEILENINEDLDEIFKPLIIENEYQSKEEQFISFEQYKSRLHEVIMARNN